MQLGRSTKVLGNIKIQPPLNFTFKWEEEEQDDDDDDDGVDDVGDDDDDNDALPVVVAVRGKAQASAVYI